MQIMQLILADCLDAMQDMDAESVDTIICDPPYGLEFMGKDWDKLDYEIPQWIRDRLEGIDGGGRRGESWKKKCEIYRASGQYEKNRKRKLARHLKKRPNDLCAKRALRKLSGYSD